jgi:hypothetical protein
VRGTPAPGSIAQLGALVFYLGEDGFYSFDGSNSTPIGAGKVDKTFLADLDQSYFHRISSTVDPQNKLVLWAYPGSGSAGGMPNRIIAYNWELGRWSLIDGIQCQILCRTLGFGYTLERLDALGGSLDALPFPLDSRAWTDGRVLLSGFDTGNRLGYFDGPNLAARVETGEVQFFPGRRALVTAVRPIVDGGTPSVAVAGRDLTIAAPAYGAPVAVNGLGEAPQRSTARYHRAQIAIPAGQRWQHIQGVEFTARPEGVR